MKTEEESIELVFNFKDLEAFKEELQKAPPPGWVKTRDLGGSKKSSYVPLAIQQALADHFFRECDVAQETYQVIVNEILCTVKLSLLPDFPHAEHRYITGTASKPIQMDSQSTPSKFPLNKKANALEYNAPAARSAAISNALTTFANIFGRNLGRDVSNDYSIKPKTKEDENKS
jgi:hypothetical protein